MTQIEYDMLYFDLNYEVYTMRSYLISPSGTQ